MASLSDLAREHTDLNAEQVAHLQRLVRNWGLLADISFSDLLLLARVKGEPTTFMVLGHVRPTTGQTLYQRDPIGEHYAEGARPLAAKAYSIGAIVEGVLNLPTAEVAQVLSVPVVREGSVLAVLSRDSLPPYGRRPSELERAYTQVFDRFARMTAGGDFPYERDEGQQYRAPRVGDGVLVLGSDARVEYASPNAVSALHRLGVHLNAIGATFGELGIDELFVRQSFAHRQPGAGELERGRDTTVVLRCLPMIEDDEVTGAVVLLRDVSELRRRDRLLLSKDATIREIHHRVKNNLQTISSLLRLQGRRLHSDEAKAAVEESVRRIGAIALVHETLARDWGDSDDVPFLEIAQPLVAMVEAALSSPDRTVHLSISGVPAVVSSDVAMPLAVVVTELLQNAVAHAYPETIDDAGEVLVELTASDGEVCIEVCDDGVGLPEGFSIEKASGLGLTIVKTFIVDDLRGSITMQAGRGGVGTSVVVRVPSSDAPD